MFETIHAEIPYTLPTDEKLVNESFGPKNIHGRRTGAIERRKMEIRNGRLLANRLSLEDQGLVFVEHKTKVTNFFDEEEVKAVYYPEIEELIRRESGASRVVIFDHALRSGDETEREEKLVRNPVLQAHNDYTEWSGPQRVRDLLPDEADALLSRRFAVVQTWRPINQPVRNEHLAIADAQSIGTSELIPSARIYPNRRGEVYHMTHNPAHRWYYFPNMQRNEAMVFKCYDSLKDGRARWTAHCAFDDPTAPPNVPRRESIEMRTLAFF